MSNGYESTVNQQRFIPTKSSSSARHGPGHCSLRTEASVPRNGVWRRTRLHSIKAFKEVEDSSCRTLLRKNCVFAVMLSEIELDVFHFFDRTTLEGLQIHSRYLRDLIYRQARAFSVRYIHEVDVSASSFHLLFQNERKSSICFIRILVTL